MICQCCCDVCCVTSVVVDQMVLRVSVSVQLPWWRSLMIDSLKKQTSSFLCSLFLSILFPLHHSLKNIYSRFFLGGRSALILQIDCSFHQCHCLHHFQSPNIFFANIYINTYIHTYKYSWSRKFTYTLPKFSFSQLLTLNPSKNSLF